MMQIEYSADRPDGGIDDISILVQNGVVEVYSDDIFRLDFRAHLPWGPVEVLAEALDRLESAAIEREW